MYTKYSYVLNFQSDTKVTTQTNFFKFRKKILFAYIFYLLLKRVKRKNPKPTLITFVGRLLRFYQSWTPHFASTFQCSVWRLSKLTRFWKKTRLKGWVLGSSRMPSRPVLFTSSITETKTNILKYSSNCSLKRFILVFEVETQLNTL